MKKEEKSKQMEESGVKAPARMCELDEAELSRVSGGGHGDRCNYLECPYRDPKTTICSWPGGGCGF